MCVLIKQAVVMNIAVALIARVTIRITTSTYVVSIAGMIGMANRTLLSSKMVPQHIMIISTISARMGLGGGVVARVVGNVVASSCSRDKGVIAGRLSSMVYLDRC